MNPDLQQETETAASSSQNQERYISAAAWLAALLLAAAAILFGWRAWRNQPLLPDSQGPASLQIRANLPSIDLTSSQVDLPEYHPTQPAGSISRRPMLHTTIPTRSREDVVEYTVQKGDSVFEIARKFNLRPETVLWSNYDQLNDNPDLIAVEMELLIPPADGVLHQWQPGDTIESVAGRFKADPANILNWPGNNLDLINPQVAEGTQIMVPGGEREFRQWLMPTIPRGAAGVSSALLGAGACNGPFDGALGTGTFIWPSVVHTLTGNDYWAGHLAIDIGIGEGQPVAAADGGVIVFAGWANGGYGNTVVLDHGNGYQTLYAHMSSVTSRCGQSVSQGTTIGQAGSTGNSTGAHLHFEVRYQGGFVSPWFVLPAP